MIDLSGANREKLERSVSGALKMTINAHGPITPNLIPSAAKRVIAQLKTLEHNERQGKHAVP